MVDLGDWNVCYHTETLAMTAAWQGDLVDQSKSNAEQYKAKQGTFPGSEPAWIQRLDYGWRRGDAVQRDEADFGPVAGIDYRGFYTYAHHTILSYNVDGRHIREMPEQVVREASGDSSLVRHLQLDPGPAVEWVLPFRGALDQQQATSERLLL